VNQNFYIRPAEGVLVRRPDGRRLDPKGETVAKTAYWTRRIADGDVVEGAAQAANPAGNGRTKVTRE
jgi:hypothetical protein